MNSELKSVDKMPGVSGWSIVGETISTIRQPELFALRQYEKYGKVSRLGFFGSKYVMLVSPEANRLVLKDAADKLSTRIGYQQLEALLSKDMILLQDGAAHRTSRRLILPVFHHQAIASYFVTMQMLITEAVTRWGKQETINLDAELRNLTLTIAVRIFLGSERTEEIEQVRDWFTILLKKVNSTLVKWDLPFTNYGQGQAARRKIVNYIRQVIQERQERGDLDCAEDVLGLLLHTVDEDGQKFTEEQVINQAIGFLFAAHETTATLMSWVLFELGNRPEWREKLRNEYDRVVSGEQIQATHLRQLAQMTNVLKEGERLYPPAGALMRGVVEEIEFDGYLIPVGWNVIIMPLLTHRLPEIYAEPDKFDPDRFAPPREEDIKHPYSLIGFGGGVHSCIGVEFAKMEMKLILAALLDRFDWTAAPLPETDYPVRRPVQLQPTLTATLVPLKTRSLVGGTK